MSAPPFKVKAVYEYKSGIDEDLNFPNGQIITVTEEEDADWYIGEYTKPDGKKESGLFPKNFVEQYEPETPPRPSRSKSKKDFPAVSNVEPAAATPTTFVSQEINDHTDLSKSVDSVKPTSTESPQFVSSAPKPEPPDAARPEVRSSHGGKSPPPVVAEKPSSFKDRIAAFNRSSQAPLAPVKPGGQTTTSGFIKKPFVALPPSRDAYVPTPRAPPAHKVYRREEDPEIVERQAQDLADAEKAGLIQPEGVDESEEAPKQSLKDRIAMLQKQQMEQAARRAELTAKEKPKKPVKRRTNSNDQTTRPAEVDDNAVTRITSSGSKSSMDAPAQAMSPPLDRGLSRERLSAELPQREILSDENDADQSGAGDTTEDAEGSSTSVDDTDEKPKIGQISQAAVVAEPTSIKNGEGSDDEREEDGQEEEEDEVDAETRRKIELRERMAKMSGGMGMAGMFAGGIPMSTVAPRRKKQSSGTSDYAQAVDEAGVASAPLPPQRLPMIPVPRDVPPLIPSRSDPPVDDPQELNRKPVSEDGEGDSYPVEEGERQFTATKDNQERGPPPKVPQERPLPQVPASSQRAVPPPPPGDRIVPAVPQARPAPPAPPVTHQATDLDDFSDKEESLQSKRLSYQPALSGDRDAPARTAPPPVPTRPVPGGPQSPTYIEASSPKSESSSSRPVPKIPILSPLMSPQTELRPPPPPPPTAVPFSRKSTETDVAVDNSLGADEDGESDYEGDYDTDIASAAPPNHALRGHTRGVGVDDGSFSETTSASSPMQMPTSLPPPIPSSVYRAPPPPPPPQQTKSARQSTEAPRALPNAPAIRDHVTNTETDEYDPYRHTAPTHGIQSNRTTPVVPQDAFGHSGAVPAASSSQTADRGSWLPQSPPLPPAHSVPLAQISRQSRDNPRQSSDVPYSHGLTSRRSTEQPRASTEQGYIASDLDLSDPTQWWTQPNMPPPAIQNRSDVLFEIEESSSSKRGGRTSISKDVYILFMDYSQTIVTARFDSKDVSDVLLEQRHEAPPTRLRQDQLEGAHTRFGSKIAEVASTKINNTIGDGSANALVLELLKPFSDALFPIGNRAYGALIYFNMANSTLNQYDEIRSGDIITFRNAKFQGKHGAMHQKYSLDVGKPDHVGLVVDWDGTKKKVRALEQGREGIKKVKMESFRVGDLRSGEVKIWRIMSRSWVGWEGSN